MHVSWSRSLCALCVFVAISISAAAQRAPAVPLFEHPDQTSRTVSGSVAGYETKDYAFDAAAGDHVAIQLRSPNRHLYFNLMPPQGDAIYDGSIGGARRFETTLSRGGRYVASVYFMRNDARRGAQGLFTLTASIVHASTPNLGEGAGFDCGRATRAVEKIVCSMNALAVLDGKLAQVYRASLDIAHAKSADSQLRDAQRDWLKTRDACVTADDARQCLKDAYTHRIAHLQVQWALVAPNAKALFDCGPGEPKIDATFFPTDPPAAHLVRAGGDIIVVEGSAGSGARYLGEDGLVFWNKGRDAFVDWPRVGPLRCSTR